MECGGSIKYLFGLQNLGYPHIKQIAHAFSCVILDIWGPLTHFSRSTWYILLPQKSLPWYDKFCLVRIGNKSHLNS